MSLQIKDYDTLLGKRKKSLLDKFYDMAQEAFEDGPLGKKVKHLMAVAIALSNHCDNCAKKHLYLAWLEGATEDEISDMVGVLAVIAGGGGISQARKLDEMMEDLGMFKFGTKKKEEAISEHSCVPA